MRNDPIILVINSGSTSVKLSIFNGEIEIKAIKSPLIEGSFEDRVDSIVTSAEQLIQTTLNQTQKISAIAARGGILKPSSGGAFIIDSNVLADLTNQTYGKHASNLSGASANKLSVKYQIPAFIVDPPTVDELSEESRLTGIPEIKRRSIFHALSQKAAARLAAAEIAKSYQECNFIVAHLGGGISIGAHKKGRVIDVTNALDGEGPISPERSGALPAAELTRLCFSGKYEQSQIAKMISGAGGMYAYIGKKELPEAYKMAQEGNKTAQLLIDAMALSISKNIASMAAVLDGQVDRIVLTGGLVLCDDFISRITKKISFIAPIIIYTRNLEMEALAKGVLRILRNEEKPVLY